MKNGRVAAISMQAISDSRKKNIDNFQFLEQPTKRKLDSIVKMNGSLESFSIIGITKISKAIMKGLNIVANWVH